MSNDVRLKISYLPWLLEVFVALLARILYRVKTIGAAHVPAKGGLLLVSNHLSYADVAALQLACPRPIRYVGYEGLLEKSWFFRLAFKWSGTIPISPANSLESTRRIIRALQAGEVVCLFAEGAISRTGQLMEIKKGFELMARKAGVPVLPVAHDGLWGSVFSFSGNTYIFKSPRIMPTDVCVCFGRPIPAAEVNAARVRKELMDLTYPAFSERPILKRHLGRDVVRALAKRPRHLKVVDRTATRRPLSAAQLLGASTALAFYLRKNFPHEKRIGIVLPPGAGGFIANIAVLCAGKTPVNLNFTAGRAALETSLRIGEIKTVISAEAMKSKVQNFPWPECTLDLATVMKSIGKPKILAWIAAAWVLPNQLFADLLGLPKIGDNAEAGLLFTSGSSGEPKGVPLTHRNILANCWQISSLSVLPRSATILGCLPLFHSFGFTVTTWYPLLRGCRTVTVPSPLDTRKIVDAVREEEATVLVGAPTFLRPLLKRAESGELRSIELVVSGAEKLTRELHDAYMDRFHIEIMQGYGLTECSPVCSVNQHHPPLPTETAEFQSGKHLGSVGRLFPGMTARIVDPETYADLPLTETGMLLLRGANVFGGYLLDEAKTQAAFRDGWFVTGDLARFDDDGYLFIEGRLSRFSKIGGEMVPHGTIEQKILDVYAWEQTEGPTAMVTGVPDPTKGETIVLLTTKEVTADDLREKLSALGLPNLWVPKVVFRVEKIPVLGTGKLDLKGCKELAQRMSSEIS